MPTVSKKSSPGTKQLRLRDKLDITPGKPVDLAVWAVTKAGFKCKHIPTLIPVSFKTDIYANYVVEGEIITVIPEKAWQFKGDVRMKGRITGTRVDIKALNLTPLPLLEREIFDPDIEFDLIEGGDDPFDKYYIPMLAYGPRKEYEIKQSIMINDSEDCIGDPFSKSVCEGYGDRNLAFEAIRETLAMDIRCIDAHAHLGNLEYNVSEALYEFTKDKAIHHYEVGMQIAQLSLGPVFHGLLPLKYVNNRPYLRCINGYGRCLLRNGRSEEAAQIFEKMLWLNPQDEQCARCFLETINKKKM